MEPVEFIPLLTGHYWKWRIYLITDKLGIPRKAGDLSSDAADGGYRPSGTWIHERRSRSLAARQHQDNGERLYAADTSQCEGGVKLADAGGFLEEAAASGEKLLRNAPQCSPIGGRGGCKCLKRMAPQVGLEPTTLRLTAGCSAIELLRSGQRPSTG